jgi:hypothetical protein
MQPDNEAQAKIDEGIKQQMVDKAVADRRVQELKALTPNTPPDEFAYIKESDRKWNDDVISFNEFMERPIEDKFPTGFLGSDMSDITFEKGSIKSSQISSISASKLVEVIASLSRLSSVTASSYTLNDAAGVVLLTHLNDTDPTNVLMAIAEITGYYNTVNTNYVIPWGGTTDPSKWQVYYAACYHANIVYGANPGHSMTYTHYVRNITGSQQNIYWRVRWRYLGRIG